VLLNRAAGGFPWKDAVLGRPAVRPPLVEAGTGALFALVALRFGLSWELPAFVFLAAVAVLLTVVDLQHRLLPNRVVLPSLAAGVLLLTDAALAEQAWAPLLRAGLGAVVLFAAFLVLALISPSSLGMGDVKLAALLGLLLGRLGWSAVLWGGVAGFLLQGLAGAVLLATRRVRRGGDIPFGPAMLAGAAVTVGIADLLAGGAISL
jgi:leader peptidase (prepilin peptidase)/N-methyltransferase